MTRQDFLDRLRAGLRGLPQPAIDDFVSDYEAHFADGVAAGRTEAQIAQALGDPLRLARELRAEAGLKRWEEKRSPSSALGAVFALLGLGAIDFLILLPIIGPVLAVILTVYLAVLAGLCVGVVVLVGGIITFNGVTILGGAGLVAASVAAGALQTLICLWLTNLVVWYARLHLKLVKPAVGSVEN